MHKNIRLTTKYLQRVKNEHSETDIKYLVALFLFEALTYIVELQPQIQEWTIQLGGAGLAAILLSTAYRMARVSPLNIWIPTFWFRTAAAVYCGLGTLVPFIANNETIKFMQGLSSFENIDLAKNNLIYCGGIIITLSISKIFDQGHLKTLLPKNIFENPPSKYLLASFITFGFLLRYGISIPASLGLDIVTPGYLITLSNIYYVAIFMLVSQAFGTDWRYTISATILILIDVVISIITFSKNEVIVLLIFVSLGVLSGGVTRRRIFFIAGMASLTFLVLQPFTLSARAELGMRTGTTSVGTISQRFEVTRDYLSGTLINDESGIDYGLARLSYVVPDSYVVKQYDRGYPGETFNSALYVFIPRIVWPSKPLISVAGVSLSNEMWGFDTTSTGVIMYAEGYWNFGILGIILVSLILGLVLGLLNRYARNGILRGDWWSLPVIVTGINIGTRVDGYFVNDLLGKALMAVCLALAVEVAKASVGKRFSRRTIRKSGA